MQPARVVPIGEPAEPQAVAEPQPAQTAPVAPAPPTQSNEWEVRFDALEDYCSDTFDPYGFE
jgi:hypothetical protein